MTFIYRLFNEFGLSYVGSTTRQIKTRFSEHKSKSKFKKSPSYLIFKNSKNVKIELLEKCNLRKRFERENYWLNKFENKTNKCVAWQGPKGFKKSNGQIKNDSIVMKKRWKTQREFLLNCVNKHKTSKFQSFAGKISKQKEYEKKPLLIVIEKETGLVLGSFKIQNELCKLLGIKSRKTINRLMNGKGIYANKYSFRRVSQSV